MEKDLIKFVEDLKKILKDNLRSFVLYGSAATGEYYKTSDYNTLLILNDINLNVLKDISKPIKKWIKKGNPPPLIFTHDRILKSEDVFPLEFLDIKENHKVLYGEDIFADMEISTENLRLEIERELKSNLIRLRQAYILTEGNFDKIKQLLLTSISTFIALLKGFLRLNKSKVPVKKRDIINEVSNIIDINVDVFNNILDEKEGKSVFKKENINNVFYSYLIEIEKITDKIDNFKI